jgi:hypothetical protein
VRGDAGAIVVDTDDRFVLAPQPDDVVGREVQRIVDQIAECITPRRDSICRRLCGSAGHTALPVHLGPLEGVLNTPRHHRVHHACNEAAEPPIVTKTSGSTCWNEPAAGGNRKIAGVAAFVAYGTRSF